MKVINITGKHNIDKISEIGNDTYKAVRTHMVHLNESDLDHNLQEDMIRGLYLNVDFDEMKPNTYLKSLFKSELKNKIQGYKGQDIKKEIHNQSTIINYEDVLEKLVERRLTCFYCNKQIVILYVNVRDPSQWTLDRINNDLSHTKENTCISCLKCNLQRRLIHSDKFIFTKKLRINKI